MLVGSGRVRGVSGRLVGRGMIGLFLCCIIRLIWLNRLLLKIYLLALIDH